tara:strand:- start:300 stop:554 length:255 start_codon:yes stop_codon:yes gene_type:complete
MLYGNSKNTTFTQSVYNCNAAVGFSLALLLRDFFPTALIGGWYWYVLGAILFSVPGVISSFQQFKTGYSLAQVKLTDRPCRTFS